MVNVLVLKEHGTNCEFESKHAFELAGARLGMVIATPDIDEDPKNILSVDIVHMNDLIKNPKKIFDYQILMFPGGFSHGDDTGSGYAWANRIRNKMWDEVRKYVEGDHLTLGVCNGFQALVNLGLLPNLNGKYTRSAALLHNDFPRYLCRWVDLQFSGKSPWTEGIDKISLPIAHGEGKFYAAPETLAEIKERNLVAARYVQGEVCTSQNLPANPNGALDDIAGITDPSGRILGMMPHPERAVDFTHRPDWTLLKELYKRTGREMPSEGPGLQLFINALNYFK